MIHPDEGRLRALLDEELPEAEAAELRAHLGSCAACDAALRRTEETQVLTTALLDAIDVPAPVERVRARLAERRGGAPRQKRSFWVGRSDLAKAALLLLGFSGAVAAAVHPASPLRRLIGTERSVTATAPTAPVQPEAATLAGPAREVGVRLSVAGEGARVALGGATPRGTIELSWVVESTAAVYAPEGTTFSTSEAAGRIDAELAPGIVRIELPIGAPRASLIVNGRVYMEKVGERIEYPGVPALVEGQKVRFEVR
jgi:hypothetical protein